MSDVTLKSTLPVVLPETVTEAVGASRKGQKDRTNIHQRSEKEQSAQKLDVSVSFEQAQVAPISVH